jgi:Zn-dependent protease/predicted transcriptional regulator
MFTRSFEVFKLFGFSVRIDASWIVIAILVVWSLATGFFPYFYPGMSVGTYWWMGVVGALGLFFSIVLHEFAHSWVARHRGMEMRGITLFIFGGVAEMDDEPPSPGTEFLMALAGPVASMLIAGASFGMWWLSGQLNWATPAGAVFWYLGWINAVLAVFNLIPAFPLDGGRIFRSILWRLTGSLRKATRVSSLIGSGFGVLLIALGILAFISGNFIGGIWWFLLGLFVRGAASTSYRQLRIRHVLEGEPIRRFIQPEVTTVPPSMSIQQLVEDQIYRHHFKMYPVVSEGRLIGCVKTERVKEVPRAEWAQHEVAEIAEPCSEHNTIEPDADALAALTKMQRDGNSRLMVVHDGHLEGIISLRDMARLISLKLDLEEADGDLKGR